ARGRQAHRRGLHQRADRRDAGDQPQDRRAPPREHHGQARDARSRPARPLRDPPRAGRAL
ncbi:MAG: Two-component transcriptional response regulator, LuxR family, partial [uncultured Solirubrobacteraceae bacterium]